MVDGTAQGFRTDAGNRRISVRFRLPKEAEPGLWYVRARPEPGGVQKCIRNFIVVPPAAGTMAFSMTRYWPAAIGMAILALIVALLFSRRRRAAPKAYPEIVNKVNEHIRANLTAPLKVEDIAKTFGMSQSNLRKIYNKSCGKSLKSHILEARLERAKKELIETNKPVSEILYPLGFSDPSHFSSQFRNHFGMSPLEFRKKSRKY
jgi:AraC-like DNA-binding protein